jgi:hypothetical protein
VGRRPSADNGHALARLGHRAEIWTGRVLAVLVDFSRAMGVIECLIAQAAEMSHCGLRGIATARRLAAAATWSVKVSTFTALSATATAGAASTDPNPGNNSASTTTNMISSADLLLGLTASTNQAAINVPVSFTATSLNQGPSDAQNVAITLTLSPDFRFSNALPGRTSVMPLIARVKRCSVTLPMRTLHPGQTRTRSDVLQARQYRPFHGDGMGLWRCVRSEVVVSPLARCDSARSWPIRRKKPS